jgi:predicted ATPase/DNA-binding SARP family transcriptional activator/Tfp pilus assembly protein PilF
MKMGTTFRLRFLGPVQVERDGEPLRGFRSRKALALLGYLVAQGQALPREHLCDLFWGDQTESRGRANLSWVLHKLTNLLPACLEADRHTVQFQRSEPYWLDVDAFEQLEAQGEAAALADAVELYRGEFLEGLYLQDCAEFELWAVAERERWRQRVLQALETLVSHHSRCGEYEAALRFARRLLAVEPWQEETHRQVMRLLARSGQRAAALAQYESCRRVLAEELGAKPIPETTALYERIQLADSARRHNLPAQPTPFVGRKKDLAEIAELLDNADCRLLTITGPGGVGKTRLALQAGEARTGAFLEGVYFVPLAAVSSADFLVSAIADALQFSFSDRGDPQVQLLNYLRGKEALLILDNFEHLIPPSGGDKGGAELLGEILQKAPEVKLLVTSRERLNLRWEWRFEIEGLEYPSAETPAEKELGDYSAVQLFHQVARRAQRRFSLSAQDKTALVRICRLVEGLPLGIELAAAWVEVHTCEEIAEEIERSLDLLATSMRDVPRRHRSVRATFEYSWRLLTRAEQDVFLKLSVFRQGFSPQAAGEVATASPAMLELLVNKSLLRRLPSGRYEMHELLRQYAVEKLATLPEAQNGAHSRHCAHFIAFLQRQESDLAGAGVAKALAAIRVEMANVRAAWGWAVQGAGLEEIGRGLNGLSRFYLFTGPFPEGQGLITMAVDCARALVDKKHEREQEARGILSRLLVEQARFLNRQSMYEQAIVAAQEAIDQARIGQALYPEAAGYLQWGRALWCQGDYTAARSQFESALGLAQDTANWFRLQPESSIESPHLVQVGALRNLGNVFLYQGDYARARAYYEQALHISQKIGDQQVKGRILSNLGLVSTYQGDFGAAGFYYEQTLRTSREIGDLWSEGTVISNLGLLSNLQGDFAKARTYYEQGLRINRDLGDQRVEGIVLSNLGLLCHRQGDYEAAREFSVQALHMAQDLDDRFLQGYALTHLGHALAGLGHLTQAAAAYQEAVNVRRELGQRNLALESLAGLARVSLDQGELAHAHEQVQEILAHLETGNLDGVVEPLWVYLTCYRVLKASDDPRAQEILNSAHALLQEQAAKISDEEMQRSFLENVAIHREILREALKAELG